MFHVGAFNLATRAIFGFDDQFYCITPILCHNLLQPGIFKLSNFQEWGACWAQQKEMLPLQRLPCRIHH